MNTHMKALSPIRYPSLILPGGLTRPSYYPLHFFFMNLFGFLYFVEFYARSKGFLGSAVVKNPPASAGDAGDMGSIPRSEISPEGGNGSPLQYSCLGNPWTEEHYHYYYARKSQVKLKTCLGDYFPQEACID